MWHYSLLNQRDEHGHWVVGRVWPNGDCEETLFRAPGSLSVYEATDYVTMMNAIANPHHQENG